MSTVLIIVGVYCRDGSPVELIGLCASVVKWLGDLNESKAYRHEGVQRTVKGANNFNPLMSLIYSLCNSNDNLKRYPLEVDFKKSCKT